MFGNKKDKKARLETIVRLVNEKQEVTQRDLARSLGVSDDTISDDLVTLESKGVLLCQRGRKISLLTRWFGNK